MRLLNHLHFLAAVISEVMTIILISTLLIGEVLLFVARNIISLDEK